MSQEVNRKYEENAPNVYEFNSANIDHIECPLHTEENPQLICELCAQNSRIDSGTPDNVLQQVTTLIHLEHYYHALQQAQYANNIVAHVQ